MKYTIKLRFDTDFESETVPVMRNCLDETVLMIEPSP